MKFRLVQTVFDTAIGWQSNQSRQEDKIGGHVCLRNGTMFDPDEQIFVK